MEAGISYLLCKFLGVLIIKNIKVKVVCLDAGEGKIKKRKSKKKGSLHPDVCVDDWMKSINN